MELLIAGKMENVAQLERRIALAKEFGHKEIVVLYTKHEKERPKGVKHALLVTAVNQASSMKKQYDLIVGPCERDFFESKSVDALLEPEAQSRKDFIHHRNSGLNQVLLKLCQPTSKRPGKMIITSSRLLLGKRPSEMLGRMLQNARFCKKYKVAYHVTSGATNVWEQRDKACLDSLHLLLHQ